jgi:hypothetical protein
MIKVNGKMIIKLEIIVKLRNIGTIMKQFDNLIEEDTRLVSPKPNKNSL